MSLPTRDPNFGAPTDDCGFYDWIESKICPGCTHHTSGCCPYEGSEAEECPVVIRAITLSDEAAHAEVNPLERAFMARIKADEYRDDLKALQGELDEKIAALQEAFNAREVVIALKRDIERCEQERRDCIEVAKAAGITKMGSFLLKIRTRKTRTVIPEKFFARFGAEVFVACSTVAIGKAEAAVGKGKFDDCCEVEVKEIGVAVEYERPEATE